MTHDKLVLNKLVKGIRCSEKDQAQEKSDKNEVKKKSDEGIDTKSDVKSVSDAFCIVSHPTISVQQLFIIVEINFKLSIYPCNP